MTPFEFATAGRILFGAGKVCELASLSSRFGPKLMLVTGGGNRWDEKLLELLRPLDVVVQRISGEPTIDGVLEAVRIFRAADCGAVIACGGGSVLDGGKAIAALATNPGEPLQYLEVIGSGKPLIYPPKPYIAVPTTAGTGSEVTKNAVLASPAHRVKVSLRSPMMLPAVALVDPELTHTMPPEVTASTGLDALTQLIEPFVCNQPNPLVDSICREGIRRVSRSLLCAFREPAHAQAREDMALASLFGGIALANARLGAVHGLAAPLGGTFPVAHGALCARLLPFVMHANVKLLRGHALDRYREVARLLTGDLSAEPDDGVVWIQKLSAELHIRSLSALGVDRAEFPAIVVQSEKSNSMKGNPAPLTADAINGILSEAY